MSKFKRKELYGYGMCKYTSKKMIFTIFEDGTGEVSINDSKTKLYHYSITGKHKDRIKELKDRVKLLRKQARILEECYLAMEQYKYDIPK